VFRYKAKLFFFIVSTYISTIYIFHGTLFSNLLQMNAFCWQGLFLTHGNIYCIERQHNAQRLYHVPAPVRSCSYRQTSLDEAGSYFPMLGETIGLLYYYFYCYCYYYSPHVLMLEFVQVHLPLYCPFSPLFKRNCYLYKFGQLVYKS